jgi:hypothetical protein
VRAGKIHEQELSTGGGKINLKNRSLERKSPDDNQRAPDPKRTTKPTTRKKKSLREENLPASGRASLASESGRQQAQR